MERLEVVSHYLIGYGEVIMAVLRLVVVDISGFKFAYHIHRNACSNCTENLLNCVYKYIVHQIITKSILIGLNLHSSLRALLDFFGFRSYLHAYWY